VNPEQSLCTTGRRAVTEGPPPVFLAVASTPHYEEYRMPERLRILIVDDSELSRALLGVILRGDEFLIVGEAGDVDAGLALAGSQSPDVILLDVLMPGKLGLDAIRTFKQLLPETAVMMVSSEDDEQCVQHALREGADGYVIKPFNSQSVLSTMRQLKHHFTVGAAATPAPRE
jgi:two-component system chemotaxis response regulator CheY